MANKKSSKSEDRDFYDAQGFRKGDKYFMYVIEDGNRGGGGNSCYFWFSSPSQMLSAIKKHMDFWPCHDGWEDASRELVEIIDRYPDATKLTDELRSALSDFVENHAGIHIYAWGTFKDLCTSEDGFCMEIRKDFRERMNWDDDDDQGDGDNDADRSRPIAATETADFIEFIDSAPT